MDRPPPLCQACGSILCMNNDLLSLVQSLRSFAVERDWAQFHSPKDLASALSAEAADVFLYLLQLCDQLGIDLMAASLIKTEVNRGKYPVAIARVNALKRTKI